MRKESLRKPFSSHIKHVYMNLMFEYVVDLASPLVWLCVFVIVGFIFI